MRYILAALIVVSTIAYADTPPISRVTSKIQDSAGNPLTSTSGALNVNVGGGPINANITTSLGSPLFTTSVVSGVAVDPRDRSWSLLQGTDAVTAYQGGPWIIPLPVGAATAANQATEISTLNAINSKITTDTNGIKVHVTQIPLPGGAATEATQASSDAKLLSIDQKIPTSGQKTMAQSLPVVISSDQSPIAVTGSFAFSDPSVSTTGNPIPASAQLNGGSDGVRLRALKVKTDGTLFVDGSTVTQPVSGSVSVSALPPVSVSNFPSNYSTEATVSAINGKLNSLGQKVKTGSVPVVLASDSDPIPVTGTIMSTNDANGTPGSAIPAKATMVGGSDGTNLRSLSVDNTGKLNVLGPLTDAQLRASAVDIAASVLPLPTGASTSALQTTGNGFLSSMSTNFNTTISSRASEATVSSIDSKITAVDTGDVTITSSVLPTGAATSALQTAANASLSSIDTKLTSPLSVTGPLTDTQLRATPVPVSGSVTQSGTWDINDILGTISLPTGASTSALQTAGNSSLSSIDGKLPALVSGKVPVDVTFPATQAVSAVSLPLPTGAATEATLSAVNGKLPALVSGRIPVDGSGVTQPVSGTVTANQGGSWTVGVNNFPATQVVSATDLDIRNLLFASDSVDVSGSSVSVSNFPASQTINGSVSITGSVAVTGPLTDAQLRATAVPVSGTVTANIGTIAGVATETTLSAINTKTPALGQTTMAGSTPVAIASNQSAIPVTGTFFQATQPVSAASLPLPTGASTSALQTTGNTSLSNIDTKTPALVSGRVPVDGSAVTQPISAAALPLPSGAATSALQTTANASLSSIDGKLTSPLSVAQSGVWGVRAQDGAGNPLASFDLDNTGGTSFNLGVSLRTLSNGTPIETGNASNPLRVDPTGTTTQPISAAALPLPTGAATSANQTNGTQKTRLTSDGTNDALVTNVNPSSTAYAVAVREVGRSPQTYSSTSVNFTPAATATDVFTLTGSATKNIRIRRIVVDGIKTATSHEVVQVIKRSTANSGGTSTTPAAVPHDSTNAAATAVARAYTANPTLGTAVGTMLAKRVVFKATTPANAQSVGAGNIFDERFGDTNQAIFLRGTGEVLAVNLNGVTLTGGSITVTIEWSEE